MAASATGRPRCPPEAPQGAGQHRRSVSGRCTRVSKAPGAPRPAGAGPGEIGGRGGHGRGDRIRTCDLQTPSLMRYQAALRPDLGWRPSGPARGMQGGRRRDAGRGCAQVPSLPGAGDMAAVWRGKGARLERPGLPGRADGGRRSTGAGTGPAAASRRAGSRDPRGSQRAGAAPGCGRRELAAAINPAVPGRPPARRWPGGGTCPACSSAQRRMAGAGRAGAAQPPSWASSWRAASGFCRPGVRSASWASRRASARMLLAR